MAFKRKPTNFNSLEEATGEIPYNMLNDYMFRIVLQNNLEALRNIIAAVLHISPEIILDISVKNTVVPGSEIGDKEYRMDLRLVFNDNSNVDIELQIKDEGNWTFRGLHYLCREFDTNMQEGDAYSKEHAAYQISFLDFALFPDHDKFFSDYEMCDIEDGYKFNRNFALFVINLNRIDEAGESEKASGLEKWCRFFKASTYDELKRYAKEETAMEAIAKDIFYHNSDENIIKLCQDRAEHFHRMEWLKKQARENERLTKEIDQLTSKNNELTSENSQLTSEVGQLTSENSQLTSERDAALARIAELESMLGK